MDSRDYYSGLYRDYYRDPFPHSLLSTRETRVPVSEPLRQSTFLTTIPLALRVQGPRRVPLKGLEGDI